LQYFCPYFNEILTFGFLGLDCLSVEGLESDDCLEFFSSLLVIIVIHKRHSSPMTLQQLDRLARNSSASTHKNKRPALSKVGRWVVYQSPAIPLVGHHVKRQKNAPAIMDGVLLPE
jgi:hypothetical protein